MPTQTEPVDEPAAGLRLASSLEQGIPVAIQLRLIVAEHDDRDRVKVYAQICLAAVSAAIVATRARRPAKGCFRLQKESARMRWEGRWQQDRDRARADHRQVRIRRQQSERSESTTTARSPRSRAAAAYLPAAPHKGWPELVHRRIRLLPVSGGAIRRNRCGRGARRPTARVSAPRPGRRSIGPRGHSRLYADRQPPSDSGRRFG